MEVMTHVPTLRKRRRTKEYVVSQAKLKLLDKLLGDKTHGDNSGDNQYNNNGDNQRSNNGDNQCNLNGDNKDNPNGVSQLRENHSGDNNSGANSRCNTLLESFQEVNTQEFHNKACIQESHNKVCIQEFQDKEHKEFILKDLRFLKSHSDHRFHSPFAHKCLKFQFNNPSQYQYNPSHSLNHNHSHNLNLSHNHSRPTQ